MRRSTDRILTTHTGSLPRGDQVAELLAMRERGEAVAPSAMDAASLRAVEDCVDRQLGAGLDIINRCHQ